MGRKRKRKRKRKRVVKSLLAVTGKIHTHAQTYT